jgi:hypothetical protein
MLRHLVWTRRYREPGVEDQIGKLQVAFTTDLFPQLGIPTCLPNRFARLLNLYEITEPAKRGGGGRMLRVKDALNEELLEGTEGGKPCSE